MIAIIDYGMGNTHSVAKAVVAAGGNPLITNRPGDIEACGKLILPGVGAFGDAMRELDTIGLAPVIRDQIAKQKPFLGICLGMQLLFQESEEATPETPGFGVFPGKVRKIAGSTNIKIPHIGWNQVEKNTTAPNECPLLAGVPDKMFFYFCHSYYPETADNSIIGATTAYGINFPSVVWKDHVYGVQFHPEKSQQPGIDMLKNFVQRIR